MRPVEPPVATVIEAGGEPWSRVEPLLDRRIGELPAGGVLELHTSEPGIGVAVEAWCARRVDTRLGGTVSVIRIHRIDPLPVQENK